MASMILLSLTAATLVAGHGKVIDCVGDLGGNSSALAIKGGVVPSVGKNAVTEVDTTVMKGPFNGNNMGKTNADGRVTLAMEAQVQENSGMVPPQLSNDGNGRLTGLWEVVTTDGAGPIFMTVDPTAQGDFRLPNAVNCEAVGPAVPGNNGNIRKNANDNMKVQPTAEGKPPAASAGARTSRKRSVWESALGNGEADEVEIEPEDRRRDVEKRATNVAETFQWSFKCPAVKCTGSVPGVEGEACLAKVANKNRAGPFGNDIVVQFTDAATAQARIAKASSSQPAPASANAKRFARRWAGSSA